MENTENSNASDTNIDPSLQDMKAFAVMISNNNDKISIHTNAAELKNKEIIHYGLNEFDHEHQQITGTIIDISLQTNIKSIEEIKSMILSQLNSNVNEDQKIFRCFWGA